MPAQPAAHEVALDNAPDESETPATHTADPAPRAEAAPVAAFEPEPPAPRAKRQRPVVQPEPEPMPAPVAPATAVAPATPVIAPNSSTIGAYNADHPLIGYATNVAQSTLDVFADMLLAGTKDKRAHFALRVLTPDDSGASVWLTAVKLEDENEGVFSGALIEADHPFANGKLAESFERVNVSHQSVIDWLALHGNVAQGGFTLRVHRETLSDSDKRAWDKEIALRYNDEKIGLDFNEQLNEALQDMQTA